MDLVEIFAHHILDHKIRTLFTVGGIEFAMSKHVLMLMLAALLLVVFLPLFARSAALVPARRSQNIMESFVVFLRDEVILPATGEAGRRYVPYFLSLFFFILVSNLLGMVPGLSTPTGNISVTAALAIATLVLINWAGIRQHGVMHHLHNFIPPGVPIVLAPILFLLEFFGMFTRSFALCMRLFANMIAGHLVMLALFGLIFLFQSLFVAGLSVVAVVAMSFMEIFVAFLQAYIFTLLSCMFVGGALSGH